MKKYIVIVSVIALLGLATWATAATFFWSTYSTGQNRLATSTDLTTLGAAASYSGTLTSPILPVDGFTQVEMNLQAGVATSAAAALPTISWVNYFSANNTDWFPETYEYPAVNGQTIATTTVKTNRWVFATSTAETGSIVGTKVYLNRNLKQKAIGARFMKTVFTVTTATTSLYADFTISNPNKN